MERNERMRDGLVGQLPDPANVQEYRSKVAAMLDANQSLFRQERFGAYLLWILGIFSCITSVWFSPISPGSKGPWFGIIMFGLGMFQMSKHYTNQCRLDL